jgi:2-keto-4-pentenoate hydratase
VVEIPDLPEGDLPVGPAVIRANVFARHFLIGPALPREQPLNETAFLLRRDGTEFDSGVAGAVMDDQWRALAWLIARTLERGWAVKEGQVFITGAIGRLNPASAGRYQLLVDGESLLEFAFRP